MARRDVAPITDWVSSFDEESVRELMVHYRPFLRQLVKLHWNHRFQPRVDPSDIVQMTWISLASRSARVRFGNRRQFAGFLKKTLIRQLIDVHRYLHAQKRSVLSEVEFCENASIERAECGGETGVTEALDRLIDRELACAALESMLRLPRELQRLLRWRFRKGMTYREIAVKINRTDSEVRYLIDLCIRSIRLDMQMYTEDSR